MDIRLSSAFLLAFAGAAAIGASGCWVTEQCSIPGDEDGDGLEDCEDPDCFSRPYCRGFTVPPPDVGDDDGFFDDDDDDFFDDDDFDINGLTFAFELVATTQDLGDDDDSANDEARGSSYRLTTEFTITYWLDISNGIPNCEQHITIQGEAWFDDGIVDSLGDQGSCENCTGFIEYDPTTRLDISNPALNPDHCAPDDLQSAGADYGTRMLSIADADATPPNHGDFLTTATWDFQTHLALGTDVTVTTEQDRTAEGLATEWAQFSLVYSHTGFVHAHATSLAGSAGLEFITRSPHTGSDYLASWEIFLDPKENQHDPTVNADMQGTYGASANFILTLGG
jgi:hypothetical protein